jgi:hypothetical protein
VYEVSFLPQFLYLRRTPYSHHTTTIPITMTDYNPFEQSGRIGHPNTQFSTIPEYPESPEMSPERNSPVEPEIANTPLMSNVTTNRKGKEKNYGLSDQDYIAALIAANKALQQRLDRLENSQARGSDTYNSYTTRPTIETYGRETSAVAEAVPPLARLASEQPSIRSEGMNHTRGRSAKISDPEKLSDLNSIYTDADRPGQARKEYYELHMLPKQLFTSFRARFQLLADEANIRTSDRLNDLFLRLTPELRVAMEIPMYGQPQDGSIRAFHQFCDTATSIDTNRRALYDQKKYASAAHATAPLPLMPVASASRPLYQSAAATVPAGETKGQFTMLARPTGTSSEATQSYNCKSIGHIANDCPQPRKVSIKELDYDEHSYAGSADQFNDEFIASMGATSLSNN